MTPVVTPAGFWVLIVIDACSGAAPRKSTGNADPVCGAGVGSFTVMLKARRAAEACPSETEMPILAKVPAPLGVPDKRPLAVSKLAQAGRLVMLKITRVETQTRRVVTDR